MSSVSFVILVSSNLLGTQEVLEFRSVPLALGPFLYLFLRQFPTLCLVFSLELKFVKLPLIFLSFYHFVLGNFPFCSSVLSLTLPFLWNILFQLPHVHFQQLDLVLCMLIFISPNFV